MPPLLSKESLWCWLSQITVFSYLVLYSLVPNGYSYGPALLTIAALVFLFFPRQWMRLEKDDWLIIFALCFYFFASTLLNVLHNSGLSDYERPIKFLLAAISLLYLLRFPVSIKIFWIGCLIGSSLLGGYAILQTVLSHAGYPPIFYSDPFYGETGRIRTFDNAIHFGNSALILGLFCLAGIKWALVQRHNKVWLIMLSIGFTLGLAGSVLSGTRSGWVTLPFAAMIMLATFREHINLRRMLFLCVVTIFMFTLVISIPQTQVAERLTAVNTDIVQYLNGENRNTSIGQRFEMWRVGLKAFISSPIIGVGQSGYDIFEEKLVSNGEVLPDITRWRHLHNQYIEALAKGGVLALLAFLLLLIIPLRAFLVRLSAKDNTLRSLAAVGMIFMTAYIDINLTQALFARNIGVMMFAYMLVIVWSLISVYERQDMNEKTGSMLNRGISA